MKKNEKIGSAFIVIGVAIMAVTMLLTSGYIFVPHYGDFAPQYGDSENNHLLTQIIGLVIGGISIIFGMVIFSKKNNKNSAF